METPRCPDFGEVGRGPLSATFAQEHRYIWCIMVRMMNPTKLSSGKSNHGFMYGAADQIVSPTIPPSQRLISSDQPRNR